LKIADALGGRLGDGARVLLPGTERDSLGADICNVCDQDEADCREQKGATDEIAGIGRGLADQDGRERGGEQNRKQRESAARRLDRGRSNPYQQESLVGENGVREQLQHQELGDAGVRDCEHHSEAHLRCSEQPHRRCEVEKGSA
jgi:hypothetical protein